MKKSSTNTPLLLTLLFITSVTPSSLIANQSIPKAWNFEVCMANNNNLYRYGVLNYKQMVKAGSTPSLNILLQMDEYGEKKCSRLFIEQNNPIIMQTQTEPPVSISGTPENLYEFAEWTSSYPAQNNLLLLWNHGAGIKDPNIWGKLLAKGRDELYIINPKTKLLDLNRMLAKEKNWEALIKTMQEKGISFNDVAETYLTNQDLKNSLERISNVLLGGKKIEILAMDACNMAMVEIGSQIKSAVNIMVASEEVEPGFGYNYFSILSPFNTQTLSPIELAKHIVNCYKNEYKNTFGDFTQSAIDLSLIDDLEKNISKLASFLIGLIEKGGPAAGKILRDIRFDNILTTEFLDPDYIDLYHLFKSLSLRSELYALSSPQPKTSSIWLDIKTATSEGIALLDKMIIASAAGPNLPNAYGLSIYFPTTSIHSSYYKTVFAQSTEWPRFLEKFLRAKKGEPKEPKTRA